MRDLGEACRRKCNRTVTACHPTVTVATGKRAFAAEPTRDCPMLASDAMRGTIRWPSCAVLKVMLRR